MSSMRSARRYEIRRVKRSTGGTGAGVGVVSAASVAEVSASQSADCATASVSYSHPALRPSGDSERGLQVEPASGALARARVRSLPRSREQSEKRDEPSE